MLDKLIERVPVNVWNGAWELVEAFVEVLPFALFIVALYVVGLVFLP